MFFRGILLPLATVVLGRTSQSIPLPGLFCETLLLQNTSADDFRCSGNAGRSLL